MAGSHPIKKYPEIGACGLDCGLCPRFHSGGAKPCHGCCGEGFWENMPGCAFITCCVKQRGLEVCGECNELEFCPRVLRNLDASKRRDSVLSYKTLPHNLKIVQSHGLKPVLKSMREKIEFLRMLISDYNDGRSKGFYCICVQLLPIESLKSALAVTRQKMTPGMTSKDKATLVREAFSRTAETHRVELKLRNGKAA